jgi:hypothetical protein
LATDRRASGQRHRKSLTPITGSIPTSSSPIQPRLVPVIQKSPVARTRNSPVRNLDSSKGGRRVFATERDSSKRSTVPDSTRRTSDALQKQVETSTASSSKKTASGVQGRPIPDLSRAPLPPSKPTPVYGRASSVSKQNRSTQGAPSASSRVADTSERRKSVLGPLRVPDPRVFEPHLPKETRHVQIDEPPKTSQIETFSSQEPSPPPPPTDASKTRRKNLIEAFRRPRVSLSPESEQESSSATESEEGRVLEEFLNPEAFGPPIEEGEDLVDQASVAEDEEAMDHEPNVSFSVPSTAAVDETSTNGGARSAHKRAAVRPRKTPGGLEHSAEIELLQDRQ